MDSNREYKHFLCIEYLYSPAYNVKFLYILATVFSTFTCYIYTNKNRLALTVIQTNIYKSSQTHRGGAKMLLNKSSVYASYIYCSIHIFIFVHVYCVYIAGKIVCLYAYIVEVPVSKATTLYQ